MMKENILEFEVYGDYALFSDPITRVGGEKNSYYVPTYEALKGILHSVYWKPTIIWIIDKVKVLNVIKTETKSVRTMKYNSSTCDRSFYTYLKDVKYAVKAHFVWNENRPELAKDRIENKHYFMAKRALERGGRRDIFLGTRECSGYVKPCDFEKSESYYELDKEPIDFGNMFHGITYSDESFLDDDKGYMTVRFWNCKMKKGIIEFTNPNLVNKKRHIRKMEIKKFGLYENIKKIEEEIDSLDK